MVPNRYSWAMRIIDEAGRYIEARKNLRSTIMAAKNSQLVTKEEIKELLNFAELALDDIEGFTH